MLDKFTVLSEREVELVRAVFQVALQDDDDVENLCGVVDGCTSDEVRTLEARLGIEYGAADVH